MRGTLLHRSLVLFLAGLLSLALATGTLNARLPDSADLQREALILAGFSAHDLCLSDEDQKGPHDHDPNCALCISFAQPALPETGIAGTEAHYSTTVIQPRIRRAALHRIDPATPLRGPPRIVIPFA